MRQFLKIWIGDSVSDLGTAAYIFSIPIIAVSVMHVSDYELGWAMAFMMSGPGLLAASLGAFADRAPAYWTLHATNATRAALMVVLVYLALTHTLSLWALVILAFAVSCLSVFYDSLIAAVVPRMVRDDELTRVNSYIEAGSTATSAAGEVVAGWILSALGGLWVFALNGVSYLFSSAALLLYRDRSIFELPKGSASLADGSPTAEAPGSHIDDVRKNVRIWRTYTPIVSLTVSAALFNFSLAITTTLLVPFALHDVRIAVWQVGLLSVPGVLLGVASPAVVPRLETMFGSWLTCFGAQLFSVLGVCIVCLSALTPGTRGAVILSAGLAVLEFSAVCSLVVGRAFRQRVVPAHRQAGVAGVVRSITWGVDPIGAVFAGAASSHLLGRVPTLVAAGVISAAGALVLLRARSEWQKFDCRDLVNGLDG